MLEKIKKLFKKDKEPSWRDYITKEDIPAVAYIGRKDNKVLIRLSAGDIGFFVLVPKEAFFDTIENIRKEFDANG